MSERDAKIGPTAHYTAYVWHRLGLPHAQHFVTPTGRRLFWVFRGTMEWIAALSPTMPSMPQYLEMRHRAIDAALHELQPDRVVEIGAGLSRRGLTWAHDRGTDYVEVDLPHMIAEKRRRLDRAGMCSPRLSLCTHDVLDPSFAMWLADALAGARKPVVVAEGLLGYFSMPERRRVASAIAEALDACGGGAFVCDLRAREGGAGVAVMARALKAGIRIVTRGRGAREDFADHDAVRRYFSDCNFSRCRTVAVDAVVPHLSHLRSPGAVWIAAR